MYIYTSAQLMKLTTSSSVMALSSPLAMPNSTKHRPIIVSVRPKTPRCESFQQINGWQNIGSPMHEDYGHNECDYWQARRAFLSSYQLSDQQEGLKDKVKRSVKGVNKVAMAAVLEVRREISRRRVGVRVYRLTVRWPAWFMVRCFVPWAYKDNNQLCIEQ